MFKAIGMLFQALLNSAEFVAESSAALTDIATTAHGETSGFKGAMADTRSERHTVFLASLHN